MKHLFFVLITQAAICSGLMAQTAITSGFGAATVEGEYHFEFSIGEMSNVATIETPTTGILQQITQGFLQPQSRANSKSRTAILASANATISPNPATDRIQLQGNWDAQETLLCKIFDANGQVVWTQEIVGNTATILLDNFSSGLYFLKVEAEAQSETLRFVKSN